MTNETASNTLSRNGVLSEVGWGNALSDCLAKVGVTDQTVSDWLGAPCGCKERQEKLNALGFWVQRVVRGKMERAKEYLNLILSE